MEHLIRKIQIHLETTEDCIENTSLPQYVVELLEADNKLLSEVVTNYQTERMYSEEEVIEVLTQRCKEFGTKNEKFQKLLLKQDLEWFEQFKK